MRVKAGWLILHHLEGRLLRVLLLLDLLLRVLREHVTLECWLRVRLWLQLLWLVLLELMERWRC